MACNPTLGTFLGHPVKHYHSGKPQVGDMVYKHETMEIMLYDGTDWVAMDMYSLPLTGIAAHTPTLTDEYLEEQYPELRELKEAYNEKRDKLKVFEILKLNEE